MLLPRNTLSLRLPQSKLAAAGRSAPLRRLLFKLASWTLLWLALSSFLHILSPTRFPMFGRRVREIDDRAIELWTSYISQHPVLPRDRYAFREVGFRAHVYAELLRRGAAEEANALSEVLWRFAPGIFDLRERSMPELSLTGAPLPLREGIVMAVDANSALAALHSISSLRKVWNCQLPVELYHYGDQELPFPLRKSLESLPNVRIFDLAALPLFDGSMEDDAGNIPNGANSQGRQAMALLATKFQKVILSAPTTTWLADPALLFEQPHFQSTGTFMFRGPGLKATEQSQHMVTWLKEQYDHSWPSHQLASLPFWDYMASNVITPDVAAFDKSRAAVFSGLLFNAWTQTKAVKDEIWNRWPNGQSQSLFLAFELSRLRYHLVDATPGAIGALTNREDYAHGTEESICTARPLYFISRPSTSVNGHASAQPLWIEGSLLNSRSSEVYMNATAWAMHGRWELDETAIQSSTSPWCFKGATFRSVDTLHLQGSLSSIKDVVRRTTARFRPLFGLFAAVPQPVPLTS